jgi:isocitrate/isopropylmalate dehydrogenase
LTINALKLLLCKVSHQTDHALGNADAGNGCGKDQNHTNLLPKAEVKKIKKIKAFHEGAMGGVGRRVVVSRGLP